MADAVELAEEQKYFDRAWEFRERHRELLRRAPGAAASTGAAPKIKARTLEWIEQLRGLEEAVAFGRVDLEEGAVWYVGYNGILDDNKDALVVNWAAPVARPYYEATYSDPLDVMRKRTYTCNAANTILDFDDLLFAELAERVAQLKEGEVFALAADDALLRDLERKRSGEMQDIVRTIQGAQYEIIRADPDQLLIVQGGPGTGKTQVGLHRIAWLLYNHRDRMSAESVLVVGPNPTFIRYVRKVLPSLGDQDVRHADLASLFSGVRVEREEHREVVRLKGELRIRALVDRGLAARVRVPDERLEIRIGPQPVAFERTDLETQIEALRGLRYADGRSRFRDYIRGRLRQATEEADREGQAEALVERVWPQLSPQAFLQDLLGSEGRLLQAGGEDYTAADIGRLYRRSAEKLSDEVWSRADVPVLDYIDERMNGPLSTRFAHVVVDEAQDLSPMELAMIARRSANGSMTILGDLAQSTGTWARDSWDEVIEHLRRDLPVNLVELEYGYRVPRQVFEFAAQLLPWAAPYLTPPRVVRDGPSEPTLTKVDRETLGQTAVDAARAYSADGYNVGLICPTPLMATLVAALDARGISWFDARRDGITGNINVLVPGDARGLEFDAVVVVEPEAVIEEELRGERLLYVALTRTTRYLTVVHAAEAIPLPENLPGASPSGMPVQVSGTPAPVLAIDAHVASTPTPRQVRSAKAMAAVLADEIRESLDPQVWSTVLAELTEQLADVDDIL